MKESLVKRGAWSVERQKTEREQALRDWREIAAELKRWRREEPEGEAAYQEILAQTVRPALDGLGVGAHGDAPSVPTESPSL